jgi:molecular chaperone GrpE
MSNEPMENPAPAEVTAAELEQLRAAAAKAAEAWDKLLRATADLENYKKRAARERAEAETAAQTRVLSRFLPVLDNFEMALAAVSAAADPAAKSLQAGVQMIAQQFRGVLVESGVEEINAVGQAFDPNLHEAVSQQESADVPEGRVLQQLRKGYRLRERLLRPASVVVARPPGAAGVQAS